MEIHLGINPQTADEVGRDLAIITPLLQPNGWIHLDISDGRFTSSKTWNDPASWPKFKSNLNLEVHLMVEEPEKAMSPWLASGAKRVIVHYEAIVDDRFHIPHEDPEVIIGRIVRDCRAAKSEVYLGVNPETPVHSLQKTFAHFSGALILAVNPGPSGQKLQPLVLEKIAFLRSVLPNAKIEVDGGINPETLPLVARAGADMVVSTSYVTRAEDPKKAYEELKQASH